MFHPSDLQRVLREDSLPTSQLRPIEIQVDTGCYIKEKLRLIVLAKGSTSDDTSVLTDDELSQLRGAGALLLWVGKEARSDVGASCEMVTSQCGFPAVAHVWYVHRATQELQGAEDVVLRFVSIPLDDGMWISICTTRRSARTVRGAKVKGGLIIALVQRQISSGKRDDGDYEFILSTDARARRDLCHRSFGFAGLCRSAAGLKLMAWLWSNAQCA